jgi:hypothetical protein
MTSLFVGGANDGKRIVLPGHGLPVVRLAIPPITFELRQRPATEEYSLRSLVTAERGFTFYAPVNMDTSDAVALLIDNYPQPKGN